MKEYRARTWRWTNPPDEIVEWLNQMAREGFEFVSSGGGTFIVRRELDPSRLSDPSRLRKLEKVLEQAWALVEAAVVATEPAPSSRMNAVRFVGHRAPDALWRRLVEAMEEVGSR